MEQPICDSKSNNVKTDYSSSLVDAKQIYVEI